MAEKLNFDLLIGQNRLKEGLLEGQKEASRLESVLSSAAGVFAGNLATKGFELLGSAISGAVGVFKDAISASAEQERAVNSLNAALASAGNLLPGASEDLQNFASELQKTSKFGDEAALSNIALLQSITRLDTEGLKSATRAAADLSAAVGIDLESATRLVAKSVNGQTDALKRYGVEVQKGSSDTENFQNTIEALSAQFGGRAESELNTYSGVVAATRNALGDLLEPIGEIVTKNPLILAGFRGFKELVENLTSVISGNKGELKSFVNSGLLFAADAAIVAAESFDVIVRAFQIFGEVVTGVATAINVPLAKLTDTLGITEGAFDSFVGATVVAFENAANIATNTGTFSALASKIDDFKNKTLQTAAEIELENNKGFQNGRARAAKTIEDNERVLASRRKLIDEIALLQAEADIKEQERLVSGVGLEDERRESELQRLFDFEIQKTNVVLEQELARAALIKDAKERELAEEAARLRAVASINQTALKDEDRLRGERLAKERIFQNQLSGIAAIGANAVAAFTKSGSREAFFAQQAAAAAQAIVALNLAIAQANAVPPPGNIAAISAAKIQGAVAISGIAAATIKGFQDGGFIGGIRGATIGGDTTTVNAREGELVLNADQQRRLLEKLDARDSSRPIVIEISGREIARVVRDEMAAGFVL
jgi:hypothetical protein